MPTESKHVRLNKMELVVGTVTDAEPLGKSIIVESQPPVPPEGTHDIALFVVQLNIGLVPS